MMRFFLFILLMLFVSCTNDDVITEEYGEEQLSLSKDYIIAHRGFWNKDVPQNSRESLINALALNIYGTEFDVHQTKDGILVINHDATFNGLNISESTYLELNRYSLSNGESLPCLENFLEIRKNSRSDVRLIIELKSCNVTNLVDLVDKYGIQEQVEYISFSKNYCQQLVNKGYGFKTYYLGGNITPLERKKLGIGGIDYSVNTYDNNPTYITDAKANGLKVIVWTVNDENLIMDYISKGVIVTTDYPDQLSRKESIAMAKIMEQFTNRINLMEI